jgi:hypothetical protein
MNEFSFTKEDKQKVVEFLNMVAKNAKFTLDTLELINYYQLLSFMQGKVLPKIEANILEVVKIHEAEKLVEPKEPKVGKSKT